MFSLIHIRLSISLKFIIISRLVEAVLLLISSCLVTKLITTRYVSCSKFCVPSCSTPGIQPQSSFMAFNLFLIQTHANNFFIIKVLWICESYPFNNQFWFYIKANHEISVVEMLKQRILIIHSFSKTFYNFKTGFICPSVGMYYVYIWACHLHSFYSKWSKRSIFRL